MSYASSSSSLDAFDPFFPHHHYAGGTPSPSSSISSFSSVFAPFANEDAQLKRNHQQAFVETLIKQKQEQDRVLVAFNVRCQTLEGEVLRLSSLVAQLEREKREASAARSTLHGDVPSFIPSPRSSPPSSPPLSSPSPSTTSGCSCSPICLSPTPCVWTGASWEPLPPPSRPTIDPSKPMSRQNPPPCNAFFLLGHCDVPRCRFEHDYELTEEQISEMRRGAKHHVCNAIRNGVACIDGEDCIYGHSCPRGPSCGRERCGFSDEQHRVIPTPRPVIRRR